MTGGGSPSKPVDASVQIGGSTKFALFQKDVTLNIATGEAVGWKFVAVRMNGGHISQFLLGVEGKRRMQASGLCWLMFLQMADASTLELVEKEAASIEGGADAKSSSFEKYDDARKSYSSDGEVDSEAEKWTSIFSSGAEEPHWARLKGGIIHPHSRKYIIWSGINAVLVAYWTFATLLIWGFITRPSLGLVLVQTIVSCFFALDIVIRFRVSYLDTKTLTLVENPTKIARRYLTHGCLIDVVSIIPFDLLFYIASSHPSRGTLGEVLRALPLLRLFRLSDAFRFVSRYEKEGQSVYWGLKFAKLAVLVFLSAHVAASLLWFVSRQEVHISGDVTGCMFGATSENWLEWPLYKKWITGFYWSVLTVSSIGYGDYMPVTQLERVIVCAYEIFGLGVLSYCLGCLEVLLVREADRTSRYHDKVRVLNDYAARTALPGPLKAALKQHLSLEMAVDKVRPDCLRDCPHHLKAKVLRSQYADLVASTPLFNGTSALFLDQVVGEMDLEIQMPNTAVVTAGDVAESLYVVISGTLAGETASGQEAESAPPLCSGAVFGKVAVLYSVPQVHTVKTREVCELLKVDKGSLTRILKAYPEDNRQMLDNLRRRIGSHSQRFAPDGSRALALELSTVLEQQDTEVTRRLCNTAASGNAERLRELLPAAGVAHGTDYDGRSPLHVAAAVGHVECVEVLIKGGGDVNAADHLGRTPLLEAVHGGHSACVAALRQAGARLDLKEPGRILCHVVASGAIAKLAVLLECGADPNATSYDGRTALHVAAVKGTPEAVQLLLRAGATLAVGARGLPTPLEEARAAGQSDTARLLEQAEVGSLVV